MLHQDVLDGGTRVFCDDIHRFGTDALLLARFAAPRTGERICDLGTGCGIIPLVWADEQRVFDCVAVDIQEKAIHLLQAAVEEQELGGIIHPLLADLRQLEGILPAGGFDLITCNPPYFPPDSGKNADHPERRIARQEICCTLQDAVKAAARLLPSGGRFCLCHRPERLCDIVWEMRAAGLEPKRLRMVRQRLNHAPFLVLVEGRRGGRPALQVEADLILEE